jgi:hypothetical protein
LKIGGRRVDVDLMSFEYIVIQKAGEGMAEVRVAVEFGICSNGRWCVAAEEGSCFVDLLRYTMP